MPNACVVMPERYRCKHTVGCVDSVDGAFNMWRQYWRPWGETVVRVRRSLPALCAALLACARRCLSFRRDWHTFGQHFQVSHSVVQSCWAALPCIVACCVRCVLRYGCLAQFKPQSKLGATLLVGALTSPLSHSSFVPPFGGGGTMRPPVGTRVPGLRSPPEGIGNPELSFGSGPAGGALRVACGTMWCRARCVANLARTPCLRSCSIYRGAGVS